MPLYSYICKCGKTFEKSSSIKDYKEKRRCPSCKKMAQHSVILDHKKGNVDSQMREYSIDGPNGTRLYPCAVLPNQIDEAQKKHPGVSWVKRNGCFLPRIHNRTEKLAFLKREGFVELD